MTATHPRVRTADLHGDADVGTIGRLLSAFHQEEEGRPLAWSVQTGLGPHLRCRACFVLLAEDAGTAIGLLVAQTTLSSFSSLDSCNIHDVFVSPEARRRGVARLLLDAAASRARSLGCGKLTLEVNASNGAGLDLYRRFGFDVPDGTGAADATFFVRRPL